MVPSCLRRVKFYQNAAPKEHAFYAKKVDKSILYDSFLVAKLYRHYYFYFTFCSIFGTLIFSSLVQHFSILLLVNKTKHNEVNIASFLLGQ